MSSDAGCDAASGGVLATGATSMEVGSAAGRGSSDTILSAAAA